jgi:hypothetical protein
MNNQHDPSPPTTNPLPDFIHIKAQSTYSRETIATTYTASAARLKLASYALTERDAWRSQEASKEDIAALAYAPSGYYPGHAGHRAIEKHSAYHYEIHRDDLCASAGSIHYFANLEKGENHV